MPVFLRGNAWIIFSFVWCWLICKKHLSALLIGQHTDLKVLMFLEFNHQLPPCWTSRCGNIFMHGQCNTDYRNRIFMDWWVFESDCCRTPCEWFSCYFLNDSLWLNREPSGSHVHIVQPHCGWANPPHWHIAFHCQMTINSTSWSTHTHTLLTCVNWIYCCPLK